MSDDPEEVPPEDVLNILVASDIHLGFAEKDPIRGDDSFTTFEEILSIAKEKNVDLILLGGDLFHDSSPSPKCIHRCMSLIRKYCMGDRPVEVQFLSDQSENFKHCVNPIVNYQDPNFNISIPIFSIHGNHDDPSGYGRVSSLDLLSASGLVNYFGKWSDLTHVEISPLLMQKSKTKFALYGLSYLKDERLVHLFKDYKVSMFRPKEEQDDWYNVLMLHQNRMDRGPKNFIKEDMLPEFLDLVIWGHEHECRIIPEWNGTRNFYVCQPGSPVATSLSEGEAVKKYVAILTVFKKKFKVTPEALKTVRPFVFDTITLADCTIDFSSNKPSAEVQDYVSNHLETLIERAVEQISGDARQPELPLIRLRVEYTDEKHMFNAVRFGLQFTERVANPSDMVLFRKQRITDKTKKDLKVDKETLENLFGAADRHGQVGNRVEKIVERYFAEVATAKHLQILSIKGLAEAASRFVNKNDKEAFMLLVDHQMKKTVDHLIEKDLTEDDIDDAIENFRLERLAKAEEETKDAQDVLDNPSRRPDTRNEEDTTVIESDSDDMTAPDLDVPVATSSRRGRGGGQASRSTTARGSRARGARGARARGRNAQPVVQTSIKNAFNQSQVRSPRTSSSGTRKAVIYDEDSDD